MKIVKRIVLILILLVAGCGVPAAASGTTLPRSTPAQEGVDPNAIIAFVDSLMTVPDTDIHHVVVVRHGKVIAEMHPEPFRKNDVHTLYSCSKTFTMLAIGMLVDDGKLNVNDKVVDLLPDKAPAKKSHALKAMTVKQLLTMTAGIKPALELRQEGDDWASVWLAQPVTNPDVFQYDSLCTFMLAAIVQRITGMTLLQFLNERFFHPLGIYEADWEESPDGTNVGGWGLRLTAESMAKAGICMMNRGLWQGKQLISAKWIDEASQAHTNYSNPAPKPTDTNQGYCYQMWRCLLPDAFRADGAYGQFVVMSPERDLVVVITGLSNNTAKELACIWNQLIPGVKNASLPADESTQQALETKMSGMKLPLIGGNGNNGHPCVMLKLENNVRNCKTMLIFCGDEDSHLVITRDNEDSEHYSFSLRSWWWQSTNNLPPYNNGVEPVNLKEIEGIGGKFSVAGNYGWTNDNRLVLRLYWTNWIVPNTFIIDFNDDGTATITNNEGYPDCNPEVIKATYEYPAIVDDFIHNRQKTKKR